MSFQIDKVNPKFRQLTDLLFFSDRMDLDLSEFKFLLKENAVIHYEYMWDRLQKCMSIFWENGQQFWSHRFSFLLGLNEKNLTKNLEEYLEKRMIGMVRTKPHIDIKYDIEYLQFVELCKIKHSRNESLDNIKNYLIALPSHTNAEKLLTLVNSFIPFVFKSINEYTKYVGQEITNSSGNFNFLLALEQYGLPLNRQPIAKLVQRLIIGRTHNDKNRRAFFTLIKDKGVMSLVKKDYNSSHREKLLDLLRACDYSQLEEGHLENIKNILELDPSIANDILDLYAEKIYECGPRHKSANADKLIKLVKIFPQIAPKRILAFLSSRNRLHDIKYILLSFPELKKLAAFV